MPKQADEELGKGQQEIIRALTEAINNRADATDSQLSGLGAALTDGIRVLTDGLGRLELGQKALSEQAERLAALAMIEHAKTATTLARVELRQAEDGAHIGHIEDNLGVEHDDDPPPPPPEGWQERSDLLPDEGQTVFGVFDGNGESLTELTTLMGRVPGLTTLYWKSLESPAGQVGKRREQGRITRVDFEWTTTMADADYPKGGLWRRTAEGEYDDILREMLAGAGRLASWCHEFDLDSEQGGGGTAAEFRAMWQHVITLAREVTPETLWFWNPSGGRGGDVTAYWGDNVTDTGSTGFFPGRDFVDFVGWDGFCWYPFKEDHRTSFAQMMDKFGRRAWYERNFGTDRTDPRWRPLMIGETACCESEDADIQPADEWLDDLRAWCHAHPYVTHVIYFSVNYPGSHDRRLSVGPQKRAGTQKAGGDALCA